MRYLVSYAGFMNYIKNLYQGRLNRRNYIVWVILVSAVVGLLADFLKDMAPLAFVLYLASIAITMSAAVRRLHDFNKTGWLALLFLIPLINLILGLFLIFKKGDSGKNNYGSETFTELDLRKFLKLDK